MPRPIKTGLDYFSLDVHNDDKLDLIEAEFGIEGFGIVIKLYRKIYENGYYYKWGNDEKLLFKKRINVNIDVINGVINACLRRDIFSNKLFKQYSILTSSGVQKRFIRAVERRKTIEINNLYLCKGVKEYINEVNADINLINTYKSTQSKVKESKVKESKEVINIPFDKFWELYDKKVGKVKSGGLWKKLTNEERTLIMDYIPKYKQSKQKHFRKDPERFIANRVWEDEIIVFKKESNRQSVQLTDEEKELYR